MASFDSTQDHPPAVGAGTPSVPMSDSNKSRERGEKRGVADTDTAKKVAATDDGGED